MQMKESVLELCLTWNRTDLSCKSGEGGEEEGGGRQYLRLYSTAQYLLTYTARTVHLKEAANNSGRRRGWRGRKKSWTNEDNLRIPV